VSCPHHSHPFEEKSHSTSIVLENDPAQHKEELDWGNKTNQNNCEEYDHVSAVLMQFAFIGLMM
jgi:hypothetical protein